MWNSTYLALGISATVLAAVAGISGLAELAGTVGVSLFALAAAAVSATATFLSSDKQRDKNNLEAAAWQSNADVAATAVFMHGEDIDRYGILTAIEHIQSHQAGIRQGKYASLEPITYPS
jgi:hypothetical protein